MMMIMMVVLIVAVTALSSYLQDSPALLHTARAVGMCSCLMMRAASVGVCNCIYIYIYMEYYT